MLKITAKMQLSVKFHNVVLREMLYLVLMSQDLDERQWKALWDSSSRTTWLLPLMVSANEKADQCPGSGNIK